ncbi:MAG: hypothetical protein A2136_01215 [Chloroflexi bacterium RBG_16_54_11]|nr:MAG: hypothetical protein A2136_01215 [Chloroflexi bacterium RBG_16_54_11]
MDRGHSSEEISLRPATQADAATIRQLIAQVNISPLSLDWRRFILAVDQDGKVIDSGQVKPHADGSSELASIAVLPEWRGVGVARAIIQSMLEQHPGRIHLTCRSELGPMYQKFGFRTIQKGEMPPYFRRISRMVNLFSRLFGRAERLLVMRRY